MIYKSGTDYLQSSHKRILLFGMSGLGKTYLSSMMRDTPATQGGNWFHYSVDYRIGTRYMGEYIADNFKREAMKVPLLRELLLSDSVHIGSNITFNNLAPLSTYLGKPGDANKGGLPFAEYMKRQAQHREAEISATLDAAIFAKRAEEIYGYQNFICDTSGSICEVVNPFDQTDPVLEKLSQDLLLVWIKGSDAHSEELVRRFDRAPKPMYYQPQFLRDMWEEYTQTYNIAEENCDPDHFVRWTYAKALAHRQPRYHMMSQWGITITAEEVAQIRTPDQFNQLIADAIDRRRLND